MLLFHLPAICQRDKSIADADSVYRNPEIPVLFITDDCGKIEDADYRQCSEKQFIKALFKIPYGNITWEESPENTKLMISFIIEKDGSVSSVKVLQSVDKLIDDKYMEFLKNSNWIAAQNNGITVRTEYFLPVQLDSQ